MKPDKPNVLLIIADEHRYDCIGAAGNQAVRTPNIDALASDGTTYSDMYCTFPICTPSRYSLFSGLYVRQHRGWHNRSTLSSDLMTFPRILRNNGYQTAAVGKMHFNPTYLDIGFDRLILAEQAGKGKFEDDYHRWLKENGQFDALDYLDQSEEIRCNASPEYWDSLGTQVSELPEEFQSTTWIGDRALDQLANWKTRNDNFLTVGFIKPHHPFDASSRWSSLYDPQTTEPLPGWTSNCFEHELAYREHHHFDPQKVTESAVRNTTAMYYAMISQIDFQIGRMIDQLKHTGMYEDTMIIYTSDHGEYLGFHHLITKGNRMYDPIVRVPCVIKASGQTRTSTQNNGLFSLIDLFPTILDATGCDTTVERPGIPMMAYPEGRSAVFAEVYEGREYMVRTRDRKLLYHRDPTKSLFYNMEADPLEMCNRFDDERYRADRVDLEAALTKWSLFDAVSPPHLSDKSPMAPDVPPDHYGPNVRREMEAWFLSNIDSKFENADLS